MNTKEKDQRFVFPDLSYQDFPHTTNKACVVVSKSIDLSKKKWLSGELADKTPEDFEYEAEIKRTELDAKYKEARRLALMSFDLTIFPDTTLTISQQTEILRVRQEWMEMTMQQGYPENFSVPVLDLSS